MKPRPSRLIMNYVYLPAPTSSKKVDKQQITSVRRQTRGKSFASILQVDTSALLVRFNLIREVYNVL